MLYLGIDQHSKQLTVALCNEEGDMLRQRQVSTEPARVRAFFDELVAQAEPEGGFMAILEVCGFNDWLLALLLEVGCRESVLIHPGKRSKRKTDRRDAKALCMLLWTNRLRLQHGQLPHGLRRVRIPSRLDQQMRELTSCRQRLGRQRTRVLNQIQGLLRRHNLQWECPTKGFQTQTVKRWLQTLIESHRLTRLEQIELSHWLAQWRLFDDQMDELQELITRFAGRSPQVQLLATLPGGGDYTALTLSSRIGNIERFPGARSLGNYLGLTPGCRNSGESADRLGSITKEGSKIARFILGQLVLHALRKDPQLRAWYQEVKRRRGSKIARVAVMRKLTTIIWYMLKRKEPYKVARGLKPQGHEQLLETSA